MIKNDMNLYARYQEIHKAKAAQYSPNKTYMALLLILFLLAGAYSLKLFLDRSLLQSDVNELQEYVSNPTVIARLNEIAILQENIKRLDEMVTEVGSINEVLQSAVRFDSTALNVLFYNRPSNVQFQNISFQQGELFVVITGPRPSDPSNYVLRLQRENYFKEVTYTGYVLDAENDNYTTTIRLVMKGGK